MTDAEGDIVSYSVDVVSISLERAGGTTIETLPSTTRIDFAQLTDLSELVSSTLLPPGVFVGGTIQIDYSNAEIFVEVGNDIVAADVIDSNGNGLGLVDVRIDLAANGHLALTRGQAAFLSVDFDLAASHSVDTSATPPRISAKPFITAEVAPIDEKDLRVRGALVEVDVSNQSYDVRVRPWHRRDGDHGPVTVNTTDETYFEFGDRRFIGDAGLTELESLGTGTLTAAFGTLDLTNRSFTASIVLARDSIEGDMLDAIYGNIVARSGDLLTVKGAFVVNRGQQARFHRTVFVEVGPQTQVHKVSDRDGSYTRDDLSVGQRIFVFGEFSETFASASIADIAPVIDATNGRVRMHPTHLTGKVVDVMAGQLTLDLRAIDRLSIDQYDFAGTGMTADLDADPDAYEIETGTLPLNAVSVDRTARVVGFVTPFGMTPPDFVGRTVIGHDQIRSAIGIGWTAEGTTAPFISMQIDGLVPDLSNPDIGVRHHILIGHELVDLFALPTAPSIGPSSSRSLYSLHEPGHVELFSDFAEFLDALNLRLNNAETVRSLAAYGAYDPLANDMDARKLVIFTQAPD